MAAESVDGEQSHISVLGEEAQTSIGFEGGLTGQQQQDRAVQLALANLESELHQSGHLPESFSIQFCMDIPEASSLTPDELVALQIGGIALSALVDIEREGFERAGYGKRAEGLGFFQNAFRASIDHGPLRFVIVATKRHGIDHDWQPLAFFDYFRVDTHLKVGNEDVDYIDAALSWENTRLHEICPAIYVVSKLAADPKIPRAAAALPGRAVAATLQALANSSPDGIYVETQAQPATQRLVAKHLSSPDYLPNLEVILNKPIEAEGAAGAPTKLLLYIPPSR